MYERLFAPLLVAVISAVLSDCPTMFTFAPFRISNLATSSCPEQNEKRHVSKFLLLKISGIFKLITSIGVYS